MPTRLATMPPVTQSIIKAVFLFNSLEYNTIHGNRSRHHACTRMGMQLDELYGWCTDDKTFAVFDCKRCVVGILFRRHSTKRSHRERRILPLHRVNRVYTLVICGTLLRTTFEKDKNGYGTITFEKVELTFFSCLGRRLPGYSHRPAHWV